MERKTMYIIVTIISIVAIAGIASTFFYLTYMSDYTYEDDRISVTVPAQTKFNINASQQEAWTGVEYNSSDKNNINIKLLNLRNSDVSLFGVKLDAFGMMKSLVETTLTKNESFEVVNVTENYTVYHNKKTNKYVALLFDKNKEVIIMITCDSSELINKLASSFVIKSFNTNGLSIVTINDSNNSTVNTASSTNTTKEAPEKPKKSAKDNTKVINGVIYSVEDGVAFELHPGEPGYEEEIKKYT